MLLCFFIACFFLIFFFEFLPLSNFHCFYKITKNIIFGVYHSLIPSNMSLRKKSSTSKVENVDYENGDVSILDLPELALESILEKLPPSTLCSMAGVCTYLREKCISDHLWKKHMKQKWGRVVGSSAYREWQWHIASKPNSVNNLKQSQQRGLMRFLSFGLSFSWSRAKVVCDISNKRSSLPINSVMAWYLALEKGSLWFPAQVYNRQNGNVGFVLSCYDAELCYDSNTDTFEARYPPHGRRSVSTEQGVKWERIRAPPVQTPPHDLHISDCLNELRPGDDIEIQWRRNKEFPYGWWYGVVGHLETCDGNDSSCTCHNSESVILEFNQYALDSQWRRTIIDRKDHQEEGNEADGFYGGIRKLYSEDEISTWRRLWPTEVLD